MPTPSQRDVLDLAVGHRHVDDPVADEVPFEVVEDPALRRRARGDLPLEELVVDHPAQLAALRLRGRAPGAARSRRSGRPSAVEELLLDLRERRLDHLVEVLVALVVVGDADVGEALADRVELELLEPGSSSGGIGVTSPSVPWPETPRRASLTGARVGRPLPERGADLQPRARTPGRLRWAAAVVRSRGAFGDCVDRARP